MKNKYLTILSVIFMISITFNNLSALETKNISNEQRFETTTQNNNTETSFEIYNGDDLKKAFTYSQQSNENIILKLKNNIDCNCSRCPLPIQNSKTITILSDNKNKQSIDSDYYMDMGENSVLNLKSIECYDIITGTNKDTKLNISDNSSVTNIREENYGTINISDNSYVSYIEKNYGTINISDNSYVNYIKENYGTINISNKSSIKCVHKNFGTISTSTDSFVSKLTYNGGKIINKLLNT